MNPPGEVWVQDYGVKLEEGKMNELEKKKKIQDIENPLPIGTGVH